MQNQKKLLYLLSFHNPRRAYLLIGMFLIIKAESGRPTQWQLPVCSLLYSLTFVYLITYLRNVNENGFELSSDLIPLGVAVVLLVTGVLLQTLIKSDIEGEAEKQAEKQADRKK